MGFYLCMYLFTHGKKENCDFAYKPLHLKEIKRDSPLELGLAVGQKSAQECPSLD